jgi:hypothetical protein
MKQTLCFRIDSWLQKRLHCRQAADCVYAGYPEPYSLARSCTCSTPVTLYNTSCMYDTHAYPAGVLLYGDSVELTASKGFAWLDLS